MNRILIVEDEERISQFIKINLKDAGYLCQQVYDGKSAYELLEKERFDLVLLDVMIPEINGFELMEYIRPMNIPVIFITAKDQVKDKVKGLKLGAEDYIVKPFEIVELLARIEVVLRRYHKLSRYLYLDDICIDTLSRTVTKNDQIINLTVKEYELLLLFVRNKNIALFRDRIYESIWGGMYIGDSRTVDLHVQRLRKKVGLENKIVSVYKIGYRLEVKE